MRKSKSFRPSFSICISSTLHALERIDPVGLPALAAVDRERLFPLRRVRGDLRPGEATKDMPAFVDLLRIKFPDPIFEFADHGHIQDPARASRPVNAPFF